MKWIFWGLIVAGCVWAYYNVDFSKAVPQIDSGARKEKTMNKYFDQQNRNNEEIDKAREY